MIGIAIAVNIGGKLNLFIKSLVNYLLSPLILLPVLKSAGAEKIKGLSFHLILCGKVVSSLIDFSIVALLVFIFAKKIVKEEVVVKR